MFQGDAGASTEENPPGQETTPPSGKNPDNPGATKALSDAQAAFEAADKALSSGNLAGYQTKIKEAQAAVQRALRALGR